MRKNYSVDFSYYTNKKGVQIDYLDESVLGSYLEILFEGCTIIRNEEVEGSYIKDIPDFQILERGLIVEYDGHLHFSDSKTQERDIIKNCTYKAMGLTIIKIPYFIQLDKRMLSYYFKEFTSRKARKKAKDFYNKFPHGFITSNCVTPSDFNTFGLALFEEVLEDLDSHPEAYGVKDEILDSLVDRLDGCYCPLTIIPNTPYFRDVVISAIPELKPLYKEIR